VIRTPSLPRYLLTPPWATRPGQVRDLLEDAAVVAALIVPRSRAGEVQ